MAMQLNINDDTFLDSPDGKAIQAALAKLAADQFVILSLDEDHFIQAFYHDNGSYQLEYRDGSADAHFGTDPAETSADNVSRAFNAFFRQTDGWQLPWAWEKLDLAAEHAGEGSGCPETFLIAHDDYHAKYIGQTVDGNQFFLTTPFVPAANESPGSEFIALFLFAPDGALIEARIDNLGPRATLDEEAARRLISERLASLGEFEFGDIEVAPFQVNRFDTDFGLIPREPEDEDDEVVIELHPGNYMAFYHPWNGDYDT